MENSEIRKKVDDIKFKLKENAQNFVLNDSAELIAEWMNLQRICRHQKSDGSSFFDLAGEHTCPICDMTFRED